VSHRSQNCKLQLGVVRCDVRALRGLRLKTVTLPERHKPLAQQQQTSPVTAQPSSLVVTSSTRADMGASHLCGVVCRVLTGMARYAPMLLPHPASAHHPLLIVDAPFLAFCTLLSPLTAAHVRTARTHTTGKNITFDPCPRRSVPNGGWRHRGRQARSWRRRKRNTAAA
jgi:hypothetical protein